jgi:uncharacterized membrane protein
MRSEELFIILLVAAVVIVVPLIAIILSIVAILKTRRVQDLQARVTSLEMYVRRAVSAQQNQIRDTSGPVSESVPRPEDIHSVNVNDQQSLARARPAEFNAAESPAVQPSAASVAYRSSAKESEPVGWETFIGQKAFGWVAVLLFFLATTFFLRYAYQNNWIGPIGRVAIGEMVGAALVVSGWRYLLKGWNRFSSMLMSAGIVVIYLATYSAFGLYQLLPQQHAGIFLTILILESMIAAVYCRSSVIGMISVIGGLVTPVLLQADYDAYTSFFTYLIILNLGVVVALCLQRWKAVGSVAFVGTQILFWSWYDGNYHPDKFSWALGFQMALFALYNVQSLAVAKYHAATANWEDLARFVLNGVLGFVAFRALTLESYGEWIGTAALVAATLFACVGRIVLAWRPADNRLLLTSLAVSVGFVAWTIPVQADAKWVALGWAAMSFALWTFGLRISSRVLRLIALILGCGAVARVLVYDLPLYVRDPFVPVFNRVAFPSISVAMLILASVWIADRFVPRLKRVEQLLIGLAGIVGMLLLWLLLSLECHGHFVSRSMLGGDVELWRWRAQLALTVFWTVFATIILLLGFKLHRSRLRWLAMGLFGVTVLKLFILDMSNVQQIYRIIAFFVLAVVLGLVARAYQRFK